MEASEAQLAPLPEAEHTPNGAQPTHEEAPPVRDPAHEPHEVEVARGEVVDEAKMVDWHGLGLTLPPTLPAAMMFDMTVAEIEGDDSTSGSAAVHTVYKLLGKEQWLKAKRHAEEMNLTVDDFGDFINTVYRAYGMGTSGEASGSSSSSESTGG